MRRSSPRVFQFASIWAYGSPIIAIASTETVEPVDLDRGIHFMSVTQCNCKERNYMSRLEGEEGKRYGSTTNNNE